MQRELMWLNLYGREDVRHKFKIDLKTQNMPFLPVFEPTWFPIEPFCFGTGNLNNIEVW